MAKKKKRQVRSQTAAERTETPIFSGSARPFREEFNPDYTYVIKDLRRIGLLAGTFLVILVVLSFFLS